MRILLIGFGVVGRSWIELIDRQQGALYKQYGIAPRLVAVIDSRGAAVAERGLNASELIEAKESHGTVAALAAHGLLGAEPESIIADSDADLVIEATPSRLDNPDPAVRNLMAAFRHGMHVVTVNKAPLAVAMPALMELASYNGVQFRFSGTVGGGTPMLALAAETARGDRVVTARGILNGTTNYILDRMHQSDATFDDVLKDAVRLGYAETDPSADIDGIDTAVKVVIFANLILGLRATIDDVDVTGIRGMDRDRINSASDRRQAVKLIGEIGDTLTVSPQEVPRGGRLDVPDVLNALSLTLESSGDVTLIGRGAGGVETATAILRDLLDIWQTVGVP